MVTEKRSNGGVIRGCGLAFGLPWMELDLGAHLALASLRYIRDRPGPPRHGRRQACLRRCGCSMSLPRSCADHQHFDFYSPGMSIFLSPRLMLHADACARSVLCLLHDLVLFEALY